MHLADAPAETEIDPVAHWAKHGGDYADILLGATKMLFGSMQTAQFRAAEIANDDKASPEAAARAANAAAAVCDENARSIRQNILLAQRLGRPQPAEPAPPKPEPERRAAARRRVIRIVEDAIEAGTVQNPVQREVLRRELAERMQSPEAEEELDLENPEKSAEMAIGDLGLAKYGVRRRRTPADIAALHALARRPLPTQDEARPRPAVSAPPAADDG